MNIPMAKENYEQRTASFLLNLGVLKKRVCGPGLFNYLLLKMHIPQNLRNMHQLSILVR